MAISNRIPASLKWLKCAASLAYHSRLPVYRLEGETSVGRLCVIVADDGSVLPLFEKLIFDGQAETKRIGSVWAIFAHRLAKVDADLVVVGAGRLLLRRFARDGFHLMPKWIRLATDLTKDPDTLISHLPGPYKNSVARMVDRAKSKGFTSETTTNSKWIYPFYHRMYKPYALKRHGKMSIIFNYKGIEEDFHRGRMLLVKREDEVVAGAILVSHGETLRFIHTGVMNGSDELLKEGVSNALYYFMLWEAYREGYKRLDWGISRSFITDGITRYKLKWGGTLVQEDIGTGVYAITAPGETEAGRRFLDANPFYEWRDGVILSPED